MVWTCAEEGYWTKEAGGKEEDHKEALWMCDRGHAEG